jgi:hypothetical protein
MTSAVVIQFVPPPSLLPVAIRSPSGELLDLARPSRVSDLAGDVQGPKKPGWLQIPSPPRPVFTMNVFSQRNLDFDDKAFIGDRSECLIMLNW